MGGSTTLWPEQYIYLLNTDFILFPRACLQVNGTTVYLIPFRFPGTGNRGAHSRPHISGGAPHGVNYTIRLHIWF